MFVPLKNEIGDCLFILYYTASQKFLYNKICNVFL